jgi:hypothetical protein
MNSTQSTYILPYSYYDSYNMNDSYASTSLDEFDDYYINDLEKQLPEYRCPYKDYIQIAISDESEDETDNDASEDEPDIENAIVVHPPRIVHENRYHINDYYNSLISYYMRICNTATNFLDFEFRD